MTVCAAALLAMSLKMRILVIALAVLAVQWPLAIFAAMKLFSDRGLGRRMIGWNIAILAVPVIGPAAYLIRRKFAKNPENKDR